MKIMGLIAAALAMGGNNLALSSLGGMSARGFRTPTPSRKGGRDKSKLPRCYPGAKLARKAVMGRVGVRHLGLRADHKPARHSKGL